MPGGRIPEPGDLITNEPWAALLARLMGAGESAGARESRVLAAIDLWTTVVGEAAEQFVKEPVQHSIGGELPGVLAASDLAAYSPAEETPVSVSFRGVEGACPAVLQ